MPKAVPTEEEMAAIVAAVEAAWPRPVVVVDTGAAARKAWRWSGRWWGPRPIQAERRRPWT
jgi:hypothetical protein